MVEGLEIDKAALSPAAPALPDLYQTTLVQMLDNRAHTLGHKTAFHYLPQPPLVEGPTLSFIELQNKAMRLACVLQKQIAPGDRVLLVYDCNLEYIVGFFACLYARAVAVPVYPPTSPQHLDRLQAIIKDCEPALCLTVRGLKAICPAETPILTNEEALPELPHSPLPLPRPLTDDLAFLQYTSGSTGEPKGVMLSHRNLMANLRMIVDGFQLRADDIHLSWLPLYHDMGLIGGILGSLAIGITSYLIPPMTVVRPFRWLKLVSDLKVTCLGAPNFAFDLCTERISEAEVSVLDLSHIRIFFSGAEPVRPLTLRKFSEKFASAGLQKNVITPCYGLAEATLMLTSATPNQNLVLNGSPASTSPSISCGKAVPGVLLRIVDEAGQILGSGVTGEICASGENITQGYWNRADFNQQSLLFKIGGQKFMRTGDMGYLDHEGHLFITGRKKEMLILRGRNYYPQDLEACAKKAHPLIEFAVLAAFAVEHNDQEQLALMVEIPTGAPAEQVDEVKSKIIESLQRDLALTPFQIVFLERGQIPRTSSGKVRRLKCRDLFESGLLTEFQDNWRNTKVFFRLNRRFRQAALLATYQLNSFRKDIRSSFPLTNRGRLSSRTTERGRRAPPH